MTEGQINQVATGGVVTAAAVGMRLSSGADQGVVVTRGTGGRARRDDPAMIRSCCMQGAPVTGMTTRTVTGDGDVLTDRQAPQATGGIVTTATGVVGVGRYAG